MKNYSFKLMILSISILFFVACSSQKKTSDDVSNAPKTEKRGQKGGRKGKKERPTFANLLTKMDANKDGKLAKGEVEGRLKNDFTKAITSAKEEDNSTRPKSARRNNSERRIASNNPTVLKNVKNTTLEAFDHDLYPFDRLIEDLEISLKQKSLKFSFKQDLYAVEYQQEYLKQKTILDSLDELDTLLESKTSAENQILAIETTLSPLSTFTIITPEVFLPAFLIVCISTLIIFPIEVSAIKS